MTRYELLDRIGVGGMAEIFRGKAVAAGGFEKPVAIKRILPHLSQDKRFVELLIAEAKVLSLLKHRNIVQIFDVGLGDDAQYFLVMEYVDGKDLGSIQRGLTAKRRKMAFDLALHVIAEICEALEHAHTARAPDGRSMSLVHRDVSPSNVLLSRAGEVKLTDFGIAKRAESEATGHGTVRGKFAYISPEQARNEQVGPKSDVFSVGILLWELVCNRPLFSNLGDLEALRAVREPTPIQRPSELDPRVGTEIDDIVMKALHRERDKRPTAGQLGQMLRGLRYSLESTVGDPATELARVIDTAEIVERESAQLMTPPKPPGVSGFDSMEPGEMTVIRIRTADAFSKQNDDSLSMARQVIDRFEEEETRLAHLSGDQLRMLRQGNPTRDSGEMPTVTPPRPRRQTADEATRMRSPIVGEDEPTIAPDGPSAAAFQRKLREKDYEMARSQYDVEDATRLVAPRDRRTPLPQRVVPQTAPPPMPGLPPPPAPAPAMMPLPAPPQLPPPQRAPQPQVIPATMMMPPTLVPPREPAQAMPGFPPPEVAQPMAYAQPQVPMPMPYNAGWQQQPPPPNLPNQLPPPPPQHLVTPADKGSPLKPWMLVVGAVLMALIAFAITRKFMT